MLRDSASPKLIKGSLSVDDRGEVAFVNDFKLDGVKRFYVVSNHKAGFVRAWHAHRHEAKCVFVIQGAALVGAVRIDNWATPAKDLSVSRFVLSAKDPLILCIPPGYANGFMSLTDDSKVVFFSTSSVEESKNDDVRYDSRYWDIWHVQER